MPHSTTSTSVRSFHGPATAGLPNLAGLAASVDGPDPHQVIEVERYDTEDRRLAAARIVLTAHRGVGPDHWRLDLPDGAQTEHLRVPATDSPGDDDGGLPPSVDELVRGARRERELGPVGTTRTVRTATRLADDEGRELAEIVHDHVTVATQGAATEVRSWTTVRLDGDQAELLDELAGRATELGLTPGDVDPEQVLDELLGATVEPRRKRRGWGRRRSAGAVLMTYLATQVDRLAAEDLRVRRDEPDAVHRLRVAARRLRSALKAYRPLLGRDVAEPLADELRHLGRALAPARDAEVLRERISAGLAELDPALRLGPVQAQLTRHFGRVQAEVRAAVLSGLESERYAALRADLDDLLDRPPLTRRAVRPAAKELPKHAVRAAKRLERAVRTALAEGRDDGDGRADGAVHSARKAGKRVRYATEVARPAVGKQAKRFGDNLKAFQRALGEHQDAVVARETLRELGARAGAEGENGFSFGVLLGRDVARARMVQARLPGLWDRAWSRKHRGWLR